LLAALCHPGGTLAAIFLAELLSHRMYLLIVRMFYTTSPSGPVGVVLLHQLHNLLIARCNDFSEHLKVFFISGSG
jgi:hypothetical protein